MWSFGVPEKILGREQVIDITDDITGEPHEDARKNLTMYVNEVGHNQSLHETIHALDEDDRTIKYFLMIDNCLKKGDEMEVFVNYKERYEENRERKCYGAKNLSGETRGDDHLPSRLMRNFVDRREVLGCIQEADVMDLYLLVDFCFELGQNLHRSLHDFLMTVHFGKDNCFVSPITAIQITAIRRLDWLVTALEDRSNDLQKKLAPSESQAAFYLLKQSHFFLSQMRWGRWTELFAFLEKYPTLLDKHKKNLSTALEQEGVEEICFEVSEKLAMPLDESRWCSVAIELTHALCTATAKAVWQNLDRRALAVNFVVAAAKAAQEIKNPRDLSRLAFNLRFQDPFVSCPESEIIGAIKIKTETVTKVVVTKNASWNVGDNQAEATDMLMGYKTAMDVAANQMDMIQTTWYLARQVYFVVSVISQVALKDEPSFSPHHLLHILGIDTLVGQAAVKCDVVPQESTLVAPKPERIRKQIQRTQKKESCKALKKKAAPKERVNNNLFWQIVWSTLKDEHGWQLEHGNRPNDFYALPPGVARGKGFRNRVDFFDSVPLSKFILIEFQDVCFYCTQSISCQSCRLPQDEPEME